MLPRGIRPVIRLGAGSNDPANPRYPLRYNTLAGCPFQPLRHLSDNIKQTTESNYYYPIICCLFLFTYSWNIAIITI